jgi:hypothetical protein
MFAFPCFRDQDVRRLHIAMDQADGMCGVERVRGL